MRKSEDVLKEFNKEVDRIQKYEKMYESANILHLTVGKIESDGDWGHGGRTYIKLQDRTSTTAMILITDINGEKHIFDISTWESIEILAGGETERKTFSDAFTDIGQFLKNGMKGI